MDQILGHLEFLYSKKKAEAAAVKLANIISEFRRKHPNMVEKEAELSEKDASLITYADQFQSPNDPALQVLADVVNRHFKDVVNCIHLLPFYPYSSDDGFSVIDYTKINPDFGSWGDFVPLRQNFRLMFDAVINHISVKSEWFRKFLNDDPAYKDYFITIDPNTDLRSVTRPRTHPLLTPFDTKSGTRWVWTTFSSDQVDINYRNPEVLLEIIRILLFYVEKGAEFIRLDAIGYLWKGIGTTCIHLPQTHRVIQLMRSVLDQVAPHVVLITETNVPHKENISYFGNGENEAQMVYNFALAPLILHTFHTGNAEKLSYWAKSLETPGDRAAFFNFIASHDGIGVMPAKGILDEEEIQHLVDKTLVHGGLVNYKTNSDDSQSPYELNITLFDALSDPNSTEPDDLKIDRFIASQAIMLALAGVSGIYVHSFFGSSNYLEGARKSGHNRTINREKWQLEEFETRLANPTSIAFRVFEKYRAILNIRCHQPAFHPQGGQQIILENPAVFAIMRTSPEGREKVICLQNVSVTPQTFISNDTFRSNQKLVDLISGGEFSNIEEEFHLAPYQVRWLLAC